MEENMVMLGREAVTELKGERQQQGLGSVGEAKRDFGVSKVGNSEYNNEDCEGDLRRLTSAKGRVCKGFGTRACKEISLRRRRIRSAKGKDQRVFCKGENQREKTTIALRRKKINDNSKKGRQRLRHKGTTMATIHRDDHYDAER
ncbi:hypothetical protein U1Q18_015528 [Sarracenia purpurea var. burkii]